MGRRSGRAAARRAAVALGKSETISDGNGTVPISFLRDLALARPATFLIDDEPGFILRIVLFFAAY